MAKRTTEEDKIIKDMMVDIGEAVDWCDEDHERVEDNSEFIRGAQWSTDDAERQAARERPALPLDSLTKLVNAVANRELMDRIAPFVYGRSEEDNGIAEGLQEANRWQRDLAETEHEESLAFRSNAASGYGVMHKWFDETANDGYGMISDEAVPLWYMLWDPRSRRQNLVDRKYHLCGKYVPVDDVIEQWGKESKGGRGFVKDVNSYNKLGGSPNDAGGNPVRSYRGTWGDIIKHRWFSSSRKEVFLIEREWLEIKNTYKVAYPENIEIARMLTSDPTFSFQTGRQNEDGTPEEFSYEAVNKMRPEERNGFFQALLSESTRIEIYEEKDEFEAVIGEIESYTGDVWEHWRKAPKQITRYAFVANDRVLEHGVRPTGFTYEFMTGFPHETKEGMRWYGMVDIAKPAQDFRNKFFSNMLTLYMLSPKQQILIEEGAVGDTDTFMNEWGKLGGVTFVPDGFIQSGRFTVVDAPRFPPMLQELLNFADHAVLDVFGLSSIESGTQSDLRRVSGNVVTAARQASNTILASLFDSLRRYRRRWGMLSIRFLQEYYRPKEMARIVGNEAGKYLLEVDDWGDVNRFDVKIDEAPTSITEQMDTVDLLTRTGTLEKWEAQGKLTFPEALDFLVNIPQSKRDRIKRSYEERQGLQQQFQEQMQQMQQQLQAMQARVTIVDNVLNMVDGGNDIRMEIQNQYLIHESIMPLMNQQQQAQ